MNKNGNGNAGLAINEATLQVLSAISGRAALASALGKSFVGDRDLYQAMGYPLEISLDQYEAKYQRQDVPGKVVDLPARDTWRKPPVVMDGDQEDGTKFTQAFEKLVNARRLWHYLERLDRLSGLGQYALLLIGVKGEDELSSPGTAELQGPESIIYLSVFGEKDARIKEYEKDPGNERFGLPLVYEIDLGRIGDQRLGKKLVHYSRVLHVAEDLLRDDIHGRPRLERVYNRLDDLEKIVGGGAEATWKLIYQGMVVSAKDGYSLEDSDDEIKTKAEELLHGLQRVLALDGADVTMLGGQVVDPSGLFEIIASLIAAASGIPKRILFGSERGELASTTDQETWAGQIASRQTRFAEPQMLRPFIDWCIQHRALPKPKSGAYEIEWPSLFEMSNKEKMEIAEKKANVLKSLAPAGAVELLITSEETRELVDLPQEMQGTTIDELLDEEDDAEPEEDEEGQDAGN